RLAVESPHRRTGELQRLQPLEDLARVALAAAKERGRVAKPQPAAGGRRRERTKQLQRFVVENELLRIELDARSGGLGPLLPELLDAIRRESPRDPRACARVVPALDDRAGQRV